MNKIDVKIGIFALATALSTLTSGCVNNAQNTSASSVSRLAVQTNPGATDPFLNPFPNPTPSPTPTPAASATPRPGVPVQTYAVGAIGYNAFKNADGTYLQVSARKILRVRFTPGQQDGFVAGTGFSPAYSKLGVYIATRGFNATNAAAWGPSIATPMLSNGLYSAKSSSQIIDFSARIPKTCDVNDATCSETVEIKIDKPNNDYFCMNFGTYCNWTWVYDTHPWNGTLEVETDYTQVIQ